MSDYGISSQTSLIAYKDNGHAFYFGAIDSQITLQAHQSCVYRSRSMHILQLIRSHSVPTFPKLEVFVPLSPLSPGCHITRFSLPDLK